MVNIVNFSVIYSLHFLYLHFHHLLSGENGLISSPFSKKKKKKMNKLINWIYRIFGDCLKSRFSDHELLKEYDGQIIKDVMELKRMKSFEMPEIIQNAPIFNLHDDCILEIFSYLDLYGLATISFTCRHLQYLAECKFTQDNKSKHLALSDAIVFGYSEVKAEERLTRALDIINAFGHLIDTIIVLDMIYFRILPVLQAEMNLHPRSNYCSRY